MRGMGNYQNMMRQVQKMQKKMKKLRKNSVKKELKEQQVAVLCAPLLHGHKEVLEIQIDKEASLIRKMWKCCKTCDAPLMTRCKKLTNGSPKRWDSSQRDEIPGFLGERNTMYYPEPIAKLIDSFCDCRVSDRKRRRVLLSMSSRWKKKRC